MLGILGAIVAAAISLQQAGLTSSTNEPTPGDASRFPFESASPLQLHKLAAAEPRDPSWSAEAETRLQAAYRTLPGAASDPPMVIRCGTTLCEVRGDMPKRPGTDGVNVWMRAVQGPDFNNKLEKLGFAHSGQAFGKDQYAGYWVRR